MKQHIKSFVLLGIFSFLFSCSNTGTVPYSPAKVIDLEHHYYYTGYVDYMKTRTEYPYYRDGEGFWFGENCLNPVEFVYYWQHPFDEKPSSISLLTSLGSNRLQFMDYAGVTCAAVSTGSGIEELPLAESVRYAQETNNAIAEAVKQNPGRYVETICLPTPYVEESITELERAVNELGLKYWHTHSNYGKEALYQDKFKPLLAKCEELGVPIYIHPQSPYGDYLSVTTTLQGATFGYGVDVMRTVLLMILNGTFDTFPNLKVIVGHMAEFLPYCLGRMDNRISIITPEIDPAMSAKETIATYFQRGNLFMTTSGVYEEPVIECAIKTVGIDRIMLGTDFPYEDFKGAVDFIKNLPISDEDKDKILFKNAEKYILE